MDVEPSYVLFTNYTYMDEQHVTYIIQVVENALMVMVDTSANTIYVEEDQI